MGEPLSHPEYARTIPPPANPPAEIAPGSAPPGPAPASSGSRTTRGAPNEAPGPRGPAPHVHRSGPGNRELPAPHGQGEGAAVVVVEDLARDGGRLPGGEGECRLPGCEGAQRQLVPAPIGRHH